MKVAVSASASSLDAPVDPRFGRCSQFVIVETTDESFTTVANDAAALGGGAGIQAAQLVARLGAAAVLTGNCGPNAHETLSAAGITVYVGVTGTVREAVEQLNAARLQPASGPNVDSHAAVGAPGPVGGIGGGHPIGGGGMRTGAGRPSGGGLGRGRGGMGRGRGGGGGRGQGRAGGKMP